MWFTCPLAIGNPVTKWRTIAAINITRLFTPRFFGVPGVAANAMARFLATAALVTVFDDFSRQLVVMANPGLILLPEGVVWLLGRQTPCILGGAESQAHQKPRSSQRES
jgi:hypothetical protein